MAQFTHNLNKVPGLRFVAEAIEIHSTPGRHELMKQQMLTSHVEINRYLDQVDELVRLLASSREDLSDRQTFIRDLKSALSEIHDITGTLNSLRDGLVLDDISLFEIKKFSLVVERIKEALARLNAGVVELADLSGVIAILDPEKQRIPHFYIYDSYSGELAGLRKQYSELLKTDVQQAEEVRLKGLEIEDNIRERLSGHLKQYVVGLLENLAAIAQLDVLLAKAELAIKWDLVKPEIANSSNDNNSSKNPQVSHLSHIPYSSFKALFNPEVKSALKLKNKEFQSLDIALTNSPSLITGANMAGKTVLLKTVALAQYMFQYGFFVPAESAVMTPVEKIMTSMEDEQSELKGLSSYASEMLKINSIIHAAKSGDKILALIDEPARTTNPLEGKAIVNALVDLLMEYNVTSLITTHYSGINSNCRRLRVAGLKTNEIALKPTIETINDYMDYSLVELQPENEDFNNVPHEALTIAEILEVDEELVQKAKEYLKK